MKKKAAESRRWLWFALAATGALLSFSLAVGLQAWHGSSHDDDDPPIVHNELPRLGARVGPTEVGSVIEIKRPTILPLDIPDPEPIVVPPARRAPLVEARPERRPSDARPRPARSWESKPPRSDLKNPFR